MNYVSMNQLNSFEIFPTQRFLTEGIWFTFKNPNDPYLYCCGLLEIPKNEVHDIDDEEDFELGLYNLEFR